jgi:predicted secreted protein
MYSNKYAYPVPLSERTIINPRIRMKYPEVRGFRNPELQQKINEKIQDTVYKTIWSQGFEKDPDLMIEGNTQIALNRSGVLSVVLQMHFGNSRQTVGFLKIKTLTFNLQNGYVYRFEDLFKTDEDYLTRINKIIKRQIVERDIPLQKKFKTVERDQKFYLTTDSLVIYCSHNEYTPVNFGILEFVIPYQELKDIAYEKGPLVKMELQKTVVGEADNGKTIHLRLDQTLELSLPTNPSTGYTWQYVQNPNPDILKETRHFLLTRSKSPGSPSQEYWIYQPVGIGATTIVLQYSRSWSKEPPAKTFQINITIS